MKRQPEQIAAKLEAYPDPAVREGFGLWAKNQAHKRMGKFGEFLRKAGWYPQNEKPVGKEYYHVHGMYWVQTPEAAKLAEEQEKQKREINRQGRKSEAEKRAQKAMVGGIKKTDIKCPRCGHAMYKERVCGSCKEGREGYRIRLMCEDNPDHEVLL